MAPCNHSFCRECLKNMIDRGLADRSGLPPRCCGAPILPRHAKPGVNLPQRLLDDLERYTEELTAPNPTYCSNKACLAWIPDREPPKSTEQSEVARVLVCPKCAAMTCVGCKNASHPGSPCQEDVEANKIRRLAMREGWRVCPQCKNMVEKPDGCSHMT